MAYTFDAGPNACLYLLESEVEEFLSVLNYVYPTTTNQEDYFKGMCVNVKPIVEVGKKKKKHFCEYKHTFHPTESSVNC